MSASAGSPSAGDRRLKAGKLPPDKLRELVLAHVGRRRPEVLVRAAVGEDSAVADLGGRLLVLSSDPITGASAGMGRLGVHVACNDLAAMGAQPLGVQVVLLMPDGTEEAAIAATMQEVGAAAAELGIEVLGGHTEVTSKVAEPVVVLTAVGAVERDRLVTSAGARPGDDLVITKAAGIEGTAILAWDRGDELAAALGSELVERARAFFGDISVVREGLAAARLGVSAMHDVTEGGLYGAVWELCQASGVGAELWEGAVPVRPETVRICAHFGIDPLGLISSGTLLIAAPDGPRVVEALAREGVPATVVGRILEAAAGLTVHLEGGGQRRLDEPPVDELWRVLA